MRKDDTAAHIERRLGELHKERLAFGEIHLHQNCLGGTFRMKDRLPFFCSACGAGRDGEWLMQPHNVFLSIGCPCCQSIEGVRAKFNAAPHLGGYQLLALSSYSKADVNSVRYTVTSPDGFSSNPLTKSAVAVAIRQGRIPGATEITSQREVKEIVEKFEAVFDMGGKINFVAWNMDHTTTPGPFFRVCTGVRIMREPLTDPAMPMRGVRGLIEKETKDKQNDEDWSKEARDHRATIISYIHTLGDHVKIKYQSRTGFEKEHTLIRARETNWGQSGYKKGEKLCQAVLLELFPDKDWMWNKRYEFLRYESSLLELDGYSERFNLAFEHQGVQHYKPNNVFDDTPEEFEERIKRDKFKVDQCKHEGIKLLIVPPLPLDPASYLKFIKGELAALGVAFPGKVTAEQISKRWLKICRNPLQQLQASVIHGLGAHMLVSPELELVKVTTIITYRCGVCGTKNKAEAKGFSSGKPRRYCPNCKGKEAGLVRRNESLARWKLDLSEAIFSRLVTRPGERIVLVCEKGHEEPVSSVTGAKAWYDGDTYRCPHCKTLELGYEESDRASRLSAAALEQRKPEFEAKIREAGLALTSEVFIRRDGELGEICAPVSCPEGHQFEIGLTELSRLFSNKYLSNRSVVPHLCEACCYPDSTPDSRKSTVFHRLVFLKKYHPRVEYVGGFDFTGKAMEEYRCGERHKITGRPHPSFLIRYDTIRATDKAERFQTPCYVCAVEKGKGLPSSSKTLEMITGRMLLISEALANRTGGPLYIPMVTLASGEQLIEGKYISTSKTKLSFSCGAAGHAPAAKTADNYFNTHKRGYCKACLRMAGVEDVVELLNSE